VRDQTIASGSGAAVAAGQSRRADVPASMSADTVLVSAGDVQACTDATTYALKAHDWASTINP
jgi:hypothetical protein